MQAARRIRFLHKVAAAITLLGLTLILGSLSHSHTFPIKENPAVTKALEETFGTHLLESSQLLLGGFSSPGIYKISIHNRAYVLRLSHPNRTLKDEERSITCMKLSAQRGLAPKVHYANPQSRVTIIDFIESKPLSQKELLQEKNLLKLASAIRKLHNGPAFPNFISIFAVRRKFEQNLKSYQSDVITKASDTLATIETILEKYPISKPTHNDLKPENILFDGKKFWLIDWEAACQGDPYFDLAAIIVFYSLNPKQESHFLKAYFGKNPSSFQKSRLYLMKQVVMGYYGTAYLMVSKTKGVIPLSAEEVEELPSLQEYLKNKNSEKKLLVLNHELQELGWILLREVCKYRVDV